MRHLLAIVLVACGSDPQHTDVPLTVETSSPTPEEPGVVTSEPHSSELPDASSPLLDASPDASGPDPTVEAKLLQQCRQQACRAKNANCGPVPGTCGGLPVDCGTCPQFQVCGGMGPGVCGVKCIDGQVNGACNSLGTISTWAAYSVCPGPIIRTEGYTITSTHPLTGCKLVSDFWCCP